jgi:hypothetical protein
VCSSQLLAWVGAAVTSVKSATKAHTTTLVVPNNNVSLSRDQLGTENADALGAEAFNFVPATARGSRWNLL